ncbi:MULTISPECIES: MFS transporter [Empedobacter]|uniref:MHS family MFS transporter n=3 Tax=Pseudomonadati TaxID=3379134 RepID=A0A7H9DS24_9FLAO|nr:MULTISPECIES: MFS transporter [Empedobacter]MBW1618070.1 MHS family MFS transporter [Empedobacter falsenii]MDH0660238.1 MHS family MFS transporter [Empedobacter sp. GD03865]MDH0675095.1 MHS family MFS transporter [Empedobacter sp. GD03861]MDM1139591.1 MHS family MFS transporter [Empedobacter sp. R132-2]QLL57541.1 MHS family MFS transporter [Empedobacter falsenii]
MSETANKKTIWKVIGASSMGTLIEWYDFFIFGSLAVVISTKFFPADNPTAAFLSTLATFAAGFVVRPFGALFFGRLGDIIGRKYTFMATLVLMGGATFLIGCIPSYESIGFIAPLLVLILRLLQGLALGGEYGGAATYVAEHAPDGERGYWTSWIQTTATVGLFVSLLVILLTKTLLSEEQFDLWGWRVPFILSILMVYVSYLIRKNMDESPAFKKAKDEGTTSKNPLKESFGNRYNMKFVLLALFGAVMGQGVVWYTGQFYSMSYMKTVMNVESDQVDSLLGIALLFGTPFFVFFGWLSDKVGRKWVMLIGMIVAVFSYRPIYESMYQTTNLENKEVIAAQTIEKAEIKNVDEKSDSIYTIQKSFTDGTTYKQVTTLHLENGQAKIVDGKVSEIVKKSTHINSGDKWKLVGLIWIQIIFITMVYGPIAAFLVEMFPVKIRYTSMSLPYHVGNGIFGGLLPAVSTYLVTNAKNNGDPQFYLEGLWYPIGIAAVCFIIGAIYISNKDRNVN